MLWVGAKPESTRDRAGPGPCAIIPERARATMPVRMAVQPAPLGLLSRWVAPH